jgi:cysteine desulfurase/selenocysteine lyase
MSIKPTLANARQDFPILAQTNRSKPLVYLDSASSAQKPRQVTEAMAAFYLNDYANIHRGIYELSERSTTLFEEARTAVANFIHAAHREEIVFVKNTTEGINLVADTFGRAQFKAGDEVLISAMEHHSNIVPWLQLKEQLGIILKVIPITDAGAIDLLAYQNLLSTRTKLVALSHASNVLGTINPVREMIALAHAKQIPVLLDGAQAIPHMPVDVQNLDCDFYVFSGHKLYGPTGIGVLYAKKTWLDKMPVYQSGGGMIETVSFTDVTYAKAPHKFEAGTPDIAGAIGLHAAIQYVTAIGMPAIYAHEQTLLAYAEEKMAKIAGLRIIGTAKPKLGVISFVMDDIHPHDVGTVLDCEGIAIRAGHHCAMPLMARFNVPAMLRVSFGLYNTEKEIDVMVAAIEQAVKLFNVEA